MKQLLAGLVLAVLISAMTSATAEDSGPRITFETTEGNFVIELFPDEAPLSSANFLQYAKDGHFDGTIFHRVIPGFVIQGGGFDQNMTRKSTRKPIENEAHNGLKNLRGTLSMARTSDPHSGTSQFFVNLVDNDFLDHSSKTPRGWGYAVFGRVVEGMDTVDKVAGVETGRFEGMSDVPLYPIVVTRATAETSE